MDKLETLRVFVAVATEGSFVAASRVLGMSAPAVTRAVARLEQSLGVRLLHRTTRAVRLSEAGMRYLSDASAVLRQLEAADAAATGNYGEPLGTLTVTAPVLFGQRFVVPIISEFLSRYPQVNVQSLLLDHVTNLLEDSLDVAVRLGDLEDSSLFFKTVGTIRKVTCAAPAYLKRQGYPESPASLKDHTIVHSTAVENSVVWTFGAQKVRVKPRFQCNQNGAVVAAAESGIGITRVMSYQVADAVAAGRLELVLQAYEPTPLPVNIVYLDGRNASAKIRAFVDLAAEMLREELNW